MPRHALGKRNLMKSKKAEMAAGKSEKPMKVGRSPRKKMMKSK